MDPIIIVPYHGSFNAS